MNKLYEDAIITAMKEFDELWPSFAKTQERIGNLRAFIVSGSRLIGVDARNIPDRYKTQDITRAENRLRTIKKPVSTKGNR